MFKQEVELSKGGKFRRVVYKALRNELDYALIQYGVIDSYFRIKKTEMEYRFPEKRELKPRSKVTEMENELIEGFIVMFCEDEVPTDLKKYIRYFDNNKVTMENLKENLPEVILHQSKVAPDLLKTQKNFEHTRFYELLKMLLPVDYAVLIQQDASARGKVRYALSHFHVRIDWLIDFAAESLGKRLRYISKDLYEKGENYAEFMVEKLFEFYGFHHTVSGRRTAAVVAAELLSSTEFLNTVYVNSAESRTLSKISEKGITKFCLVKVPKEHMAELSPGGKYEVKNFARDFVISEEKDGGAAVLFAAVYTPTESALIPTDGKLRELQDVNWVRVSSQVLLAKPGVMDAAPIPYSIIYDQQDPFSRS